MEPLYKGQVGDSGASLQGTSWGLPWREVVLFSEVLWEVRIPTCPLFRGCPPFSGSTIGGSIAYRHDQTCL